MVPIVNDQFGSLFLTILCVGVTDSSPLWSLLLEDHLAVCLRVRGLDFGPKTIFLINTSENYIFLSASISKFPRSPLKNIGILEGHMLESHSREDIS
jgi:hypothetical protein